MSLANIRNVGVTLVLWPLVAAVIIMVVMSLRMWVARKSDRWRNKGFREFGWLDRMGVPDWDPKSSWISTLTALAALGTLLSKEALIPDTFDKAANAQYTGVQLLWALLIPLGALVYNAFRVAAANTNPEDGEPVVEYEGFVVSYLLASLISLWAVFGELFSLYLLMNETQVQDAAAIGVYGWLLIGGTGLVIVYAWGVIQANVGALSEAPPDRETPSDTDDGFVPRRPGSWSLL